MSQNSLRSMKQFVVSIIQQRKVMYEELKILTKINN